MTNMLHRRGFLRRSLIGGLGASLVPRIVCGKEKDRPRPSSRVALTAGDDRANNVYRGLAMHRDAITRAIGNRRVVIKPNNVSIDIQLAATHADCIEGILEFLKSIGKLEGAVIAESAANGPTLAGFSNFGYMPVAAKYGVKLADLDRDATETVFVFDEKAMRPRAVRVARTMLDPNNFIISAAKFKTHDRIVATLSLKNIVVGAPIKDIGFRWGRGRVQGTTTQKPLVHGSGIYAINYNLFELARKLHPDLAVIDGYTGMEGNGPTGGTPVEHRVCVVAPDWLAADRVAVHLMGIDFDKIGYLNYCMQANMGQADLNKIEILGEPIARHVHRYRLHDKIERQLAWMTPPQRS